MGDNHVSGVSQSFLFTHDYATNRPVLDTQDTGVIQNAKVNRLAIIDIYKLPDLM